MNQPTTLAQAVGPWAGRLLSDLGSSLLFLALLEISGSVKLATAVGTGLGIAQMAWAFHRRHRIDGLQKLSLILVLVMGGMTLLTNDPRFIILKPSLIEICIGCFMLKPGWCIDYAPEWLRTMAPRRAFVAFGYVWAITMFALAGSSLYVAYESSLKSWARYTALAPIAATMLLNVIGLVYFKYEIRRDKRAQSVVTVPAPQAEE